MHRKRVEWILVKEALFKKGEGYDSHFDSSFCNKFKTCGFLGYRYGSAWLSGGERQKSIPTTEMDSKGYADHSCIIVLGCCLFFLKS